MTLLLGDGVMPAGDGTETNPYQVTSLDNLLWISTNQDSWSSYFNQIADIDASDTQNWNNGEGFCPIGYEENPFSGTYSGQNYEIQNLYINRNESYQALFGYSVNASFAQIRITDVNINCFVVSAALAGYVNFCSITDCTSSGQISGFGAIGGLVSQNWNSDMINCTNAAEVSSSYGESGGICVDISDATIENCHNTGNITSGRSGGGIIACGYSSDCYIINCSNTGDITSLGLAGESAAGIIAYGEGRLENCYNTGVITGIGNVAGLSCAFVLSSVNCYNTGNIIASGMGYGYGLFHEAPVEFEDCHYDYETVSINGEHIITFGALAHEMYETWFNNGFSLDIGSYLNQQNDTYLISSPDDFEKLLYFGSLEHSFTQTADLDMSEQPGLYIPYFNGNYNGNGHSILNLQIDSPQYSCISLFTECKNADLTGIKIIDAQLGLEGVTSNIAGLCQKAAYCTISNCMISGDFIGFQAAGLIFQTISCSITSCECSGNYTGYSAVCGFIGGSLGSDITNCYSNASISGGYILTGFIYSSYNDISVSNCYFSGSIIPQNTDQIDGFMSEIVFIPDSNPVNGCFWNLDNALATNSAAGIGISTEAMQNIDTFLGAGWDFVGETANGTNDYWDIDPQYNNGFPFLSVFSPTDNDEQVIPEAIVDSELLGNYPNPFNPETTIRFSISENSNVDLSVFNVKGQKVSTLANQQYSKGNYSLVWKGTDDNGRAVGSGIYFYRLDIDGRKVSARKCILMK
jgi:hypothetical protein